MEIVNLRGEPLRSGGILQACRRDILMGFARVAPDAGKF